MPPAAEARRRGASGLVKRADRGRGEIAGLLPVVVAYLGLLILTLAPARANLTNATSPTLFCQEREMLEYMYTRSTRVHPALSVYKGLNGE
jgi:hypothetical protein